MYSTGTAVSECGWYVGDPASRPGTANPLRENTLRNVDRDSSACENIQRDHLGSVTANDVNYSTRSALPLSWKAVARVALVFMVRCFLRVALAYEYARRGEVPRPKLHV